ncbi:hypothetical protein BUALT_Bualt18G0095500 [Buddleja alternifolia]|uniref:RRM domain-containing protein n=1 Tax=Buddleja alternifolia TaxID=168488 RepID=A0AAV6W5L4_9LAMI|nr:hypothetical protein BUALT_Bualt18G0095500 [Buddleja alternifolia]
MEMESGKLFIGGISWDTSEERLREYFESFGEVVEAVIMKDRTTGRARGFGFIVFANASVADKVVREKHIIDGRTVEAKKAVPRDDHQNFNRNNGSSTQGSPGPTRTKKIFVGGLASTVTETDFKRYFEQFGTITDVVVMYDHNTQRPRGFGFITYDSEEAVDKVLFKTFHELNGKMVEVKRAVPKELSSPGPTRTLSGGHNYGLSRVSSFLNAYTQGYNSRMDGRFSPVNVGRSGYPPYSPSNYNTGLNLDSGFNFRASADSGSGYGQGMMNSYFSENSSRFGSPIGGGSLLNATSRGNGNHNYGTNSITSNAFMGIGNVGNFGNIGEIWGSSPILARGGGNDLLSNGNIVYGNGESNFADRASYGRNNGGSTPSSIMNNVLDGGFGNLYGGDSFYKDHAWHPSSQELEGSSLFGYEREIAPRDVTSNNSVGYIGGYGGIAA